MSWPTKDFGDVNINVAIANRDTIVTSSNYSVGYCDRLRTAKVDTISVRAISWCCYVKIRYRYTFALKNLHVVTFAIKEVDILHNNIGSVLQHKTLYPQKEWLAHINLN